MRNGGSAHGGGHLGDEVVAEREDDVGDAEGTVQAWPRAVGSFMRRLVYFVWRITN